MNSDYQLHYQALVGSAEINIDSAVVGSEVSFRITFFIGPLGIDESGGFKVLYRTASDIGEPQTKDPNSPNYVHITSNNGNVAFLTDSKSDGVQSKCFERPWSRGFSVIATQDYLAEGDEVYIDFLRYRMQTYVEDIHVFKIIVDPFATGKFLELPRSPAICLVPDEISRLVVLADSQAKIHSKCRVFVKAEDMWGNPTTSCSNAVTLSIYRNDIFVERREVLLKKGTCKMTFVPLEVGEYYILATLKTKETRSNYILVKEMIHSSIYWADFHGQSGETIGTGDLSSYFSFAQKYAFLDVASIQGNDFQISNAFWTEIQDKTLEIHSDGIFVAFPGYEWSGNTNRGGDRNVIYLKEGKFIHRSSHALIDDYSDITMDAEHVTDLYERLDPDETIVIPHVGGRYSDLSYHQESLESVVEIHSTWGTFEWFYFDALVRGYKVGVVAGSDDHTGRLGASYPAFDHFNSYGGLTGVIAEKLDREAIFYAVKARHCYATTGQRVILNFAAYSKSTKAMMGDELLTFDDQIDVDVQVYATDHVEKIEIFAFDRMLHSYNPSSSKIANALRVVYEGARVKGRGRAMIWDGSLTFTESRVVGHEAINYFNHKNILDVKPNLIEWRGLTTGGVQGFICQIDEFVGKAILCINGKQVEIDLDRLQKKGVEIPIVGLGAKVSVLPIDLYDRESTVMISKTIVVPLSRKHDYTPVFVKVTQRNGHMVWSSPVFVSLNSENTG